MPFRWLGLAILLSLATGGLGCAAPAPPATTPITEAPAVRCRTVVEARPGSRAGAAGAAAVQRCEPELPAAEPVSGAAELPPDDEPPLGAP